jgi:hypothetical protein
VGSAGDRLRADLDRALAHASKVAGQPLEYSEIEVAAVARACLTADRAEVLRERFSEALTDGTKVTTLSSLSAEIRNCDKLVVDLLNKVNPELGPPKSERHVRAGQARWAHYAGGA